MSEPSEIDSQAPSRSGRTSPPEIALIAGAIAYLVAELAFNARLLGVSSASVDSATISAMEHVGRTIAGVGAGLLVARSVVTRPPEAWLRWAALVAVFAIVVPCVYVSYSRLIDAMVARAPVETRRVALDLGLFRTALTDGAVVIPGLEIDESSPARHAVRAFHATSGALFYFTPSAAEMIRVRRQDFARSLIRSHIDPASLWSRYAQASEQFEAGYRSYADASARLADLRADPGRAAAELWEEVDGEIERQLRMFEASAHAGVSIEPRVRRVATPVLERTFERMEACATARCRELILVGYQSSALQALGTAVPFEFWCPRWRGAETAIYASECSADAAAFDRAVRYVADERFRASTGFSLDASAAEIRGSERVAAGVRARLAEREIELDPSWRASDPEGFVEAVAPQLIAHAEQRYRDAVVSAVGVELPLGLSRPQLLAHPGVVASMDWPTSLEGLSVELGWPRDQFLDWLHQDVVAAKADQLLAPLRAPDAELVAGGPYADAAERAVRGMLIPPVALGLSLFFAGLNGISLLRDLLSRTLRRPTGGLAVAAALALLLVLPFLAPAPLAESAQVQAALERGYEEAPFATASLDWVMRLEPRLVTLTDPLAVLIPVEEVSP